MSITKGLLRYLLLGLLSVVVPYLTVMACIIATGDRIAGMKMGVFQGLLAVHLIFGFISIKKKWLHKVGFTLLLTALIYAILFVLFQNGIMIHPGWDRYGYWDLALTNLVVGLVAWVLYFMISKEKV